VYFSAKVDREDILKPSIGNESLHEISNDNGTRVVNFAISTNLTVKSTMFAHGNIHKFTWISLEGKTRNQIDHTRYSYKVTGLVLKIGFVFIILQIDLYPLQHTPPPPHLYTAAFEFSIVLSSAAGHQLTTCSAGPPFFISPH
jgi:hypothetical protein